MNLIKKQIAKLPLGFLNGKRFVFCYHDISNPDNPYHDSLHYSTRIESFKKHLAFFNQNSNVLPLAELVQGEGVSSDKLNISITIDDGFKSVKNQAHPMLKEHKMPYSLFINKEAVLHNQLWITNLKIQQNNKNYLNQVYDHALKDSCSKESFLDSPLSFINNFSFTKQTENIFRTKNVEHDIYLNKDDIKYLIKEGVRIGNHSNHHYILSKCDTDLRNDEVKSNETFINQEFNVKSDYFAIPFGKKNHFKPDLLNLVESLGLKGGLSTNVNPVTKSSELIPRIVLTNETIEQILFYLHRTHFKTYEI